MYDRKPSRDLVASVSWFHQIDLSEGVVTPGDDASAKKLSTLRFPSSLAEKTFLDIGAWDGFFSFEAERRGAARVLATDSYVWQGKVPGRSKLGFDTARRMLDSRVEDRLIEPFEISPESVGLWDVVLLAGVLYHVRDPWQLVRCAASVTRELLILETEVDLSFLRRPAVALFAPGALRGDASTFCAPNIPALKLMLRDAGFCSVKIVSRTPLWRRLASACRGRNVSRIQQGRCALHACRR